MALAVGLGLTGATVGPAAHSQSAGHSYYSFTAGQMTDNRWGDLFNAWGRVEFRDAWAFGGSVSREWPVGRAGFVGIEGQLIGWVGEQTHIEATVPVFIRTPRPSQVWLPSLAYGLGLSLASEPSEVEIDRRGESTELLAHWFFELEFGSDDTAFRPYLRVHHRSHAWETFDAKTGSNAVMLGLRYPF